MKTFKILTTALFVSFTLTTYAQNEEATANKNESTETVTKIIRIKGPNGEEKVIKKQEVITKKNKVKLSGDENDTNQTAIYSDDEVSVQKSDSATSNVEGYTKVADGKGFVITFTDKSGSKVSKARPVSNGYYIVNFGSKDNCLGHFDDKKNFVLEMYDAKTDQITSTVYKAN
ncbi:hypothetical protein [Aquimarina sp. MMG016]|uniref:hypothetical protein n=1 Tax=Aquimarina sp. MMG016 TaxID=2822690 RepID=UPI001B39E2CD|nr:hypothetical protein [Aquimarina sp. MMG016]MBQ4819121.1 hypothetical protein [Aquimarina sp. MMG016]